MQIPMDILSQLSVRTDSNAGGRQKASTAYKTDSFFSRVFDESYAFKEGGKRTEIGKTDKLPDEEKDADDIPQRKPDRGMRDTENLIAGVMGFRNAVVFILEGEKESATVPQTSRDAADEELEQEASSGTNPTADTSDAKSEAITLTAADVREAADADKTPGANAIDPGDEAESSEGEVTARRPAIGISEQRENEEDNAEFSKNGDLSPLENENDTFPAIGQKDKTHSETETDDANKNAAKNSEKNASEDAHKTVNNSIPLTESIKPERFHAAQQLRQAADAPVKAENLFDEMVSRIETMQNENRQSVTIQLKPEFLGNVALEIAIDSAGLHVKISAGDNSVRSMINTQISSLIESLESKGIEVVDVEVAHASVDNGAFKDSQNDQAQPEHQRRSYRADGIEESAAYLDARQVETLEYYLDAGVSSVEYSA